MIVNTVRFDCIHQSLAVSVTFFRCGAKNWRVCVESIDHTMISWDESARFKPNKTCAEQFAREAIKYWELG